MKLKMLSKIIKSKRSNNYKQSTQVQIIKTPLSHQGENIHNVSWKFHQEDKNQVVAGFYILPAFAWALWLRPQSRATPIR